MSKTVGKVFGGKGSATGAFGTGRFKPERVKIREEAFMRQLSGKGTQEEVRQKQRALSEQLEAQARGEGPSVAEQQLRRGQEAAIARSRALAATQGSSPLAQRAAARETAETQRQVGSEAAQMRAQEQLAARQQLAGQLAQEREQDIALATGDRESEQLLEQLRVQETAQANRVGLGGFTSAAAARQSMTQGLIQAAPQMATLLGASDKNLKKNIKPVASDANSKKNIKSAKNETVGETFDRVIGPSKKSNKKGKDDKSGDGEEKEVTGKNLDDTLKKAGKAEKDASDAKKAAAAEALSNIKLEKPQGVEKEISVEGGDDAVISRKARGSSLLMGSDENIKSNVKSGNKAAEAISQSTQASASEDIPTSSGKKEGGGMGDMLQTAAKLAPLLASAASDKNTKVKLNNGKEVSKEFLDNLQAVTFEYKEPEKFGEGKHLGILAQDLEKSEEGKSMVVDTPEGKMVDFGKGFGAILAAQAQLNERLNQIESKKKSNSSKKSKK